MTASDTLAHLTALGVRLSRKGADLLAGPRSALTDDVRALIRQHKAELLDLLADDRRHCRTCAELTAAGWCLAARRGLISGAGRNYRPWDDIPRRCESYAPRQP